jgi:hypothetical protein
MTWRDRWHLEIAIWKSYPNPFDGMSRYVRALIRAAVMMAEQEVGRGLTAPELVSLITQLSTWLAKLAEHDPDGAVPGERDLWIFIHHVWTLDNSVTRPENGADSTSPAQDDATSPAPKERS